MASVTSEIDRASGSQEIEKEFAEKIISSMKDGFVILDPNGVHIDVNDAFCRMTGFTREDLLGNSPPHPYWPEENYEEIKASFQKTINKEFEDFELTFKRKNGERFPVIVGPSSVYDEDHNIARYYATVKDISDLMKAKKALQDARRDWEEIFQAIGHPIIVLDSDYNIIMTNRALIKVTGLSFDDLLGRKCYRVFHGADSPPESCPLKKMLGTGRLETAEMEVEILGGVFLVSCTPVYDEAGNLEKIIHIATDTSEQKRAERALKESEERYRTVVEQSNDGVAIVKEETHVYVNQRFVDIFGYKSSDEILGKHISLVVHPDHRGRIPEITRKKENGKSAPSRYEFKGLRKDGTVVYIEVSAAYITYLGDTVSLVYARDITERKTAQAALMQSEQRYRSLVENIFIGIFICDLPHGHFLYLNQRLCDIFGYSLEEGLNLSVWDLIVPKEHYLLNKDLELEASLKRDIERSHIYTGIRKDGSLLRIKIHTIPVTHEGKPAMQGLVNDITESENMELRLRQAQKMEAIGTLAGGIAHDFNNILTAIMGYAELAQFRLEDNHEVMRDIKEILKGGHRAKDLVNQILAFSRKSEQEMKPLYLGPIIKEVLKLLRASIPSTIDIRRTIEDDDNVVMADPTQIHQVLMNLGTNAAHAMMEDGGVMEVILSKIEIDKDSELTHPDLDPGQYLRVTIADTGHGMSPEIMGRIFDPYFTTKEKGVGTGMGLALVHGIVKGYGGAIKIYSESGKGSIFHVYLPSAEREDTKEPSMAWGPMPIGNERILLIDDEESIVNMGKHALERLGYNVVTGTSSLESLELFRSKPYDFDVVITDMTMPSMTGDKLIIKMREIRSDIPVVLCSGYSAQISEKRAGDIGINAFIMKPFVPLDLANAIRKVLDKKGSSFYSFINSNHMPGG